MLAQPSGIARHCFCCSYVKKSSYRIHEDNIASHNDIVIAIVLIIFMRY